MNDEGGGEGVLDYVDTTMDEVIGAAEEAKEGESSENVMRDDLKPGKELDFEN